MSVTVFGTVADALGHCLWKDHWMEGNRACRSTTASADPGSAYAHVQPLPLPVLFDHHGAARGHAVYLERRAGALSAVGVVEDPDDVDDLADLGPLWWSSSTDPDTGDGLRMTELSLTRQPASVGLPPVSLWAGDVAASGWSSGRSDQQTPGLLTRAHTASTTWNRHGSSGLVVAELDPVSRHELDPASGVGLVPRDRVEYRSATPGAVSKAGRTIELIAVPYNTPSATASHRGRLITEEFANTALLGEETRRDRIPVNRDHDRGRLVGRVVKLDPYRSDGCHATLRIAPTPLGDETLALVAENCLDASLAFWVKRGGEQWDATETRRRVTSAGIEHIALVSEPAYPDATILSVRSGDAVVGVR